MNFKLPWTKKKKPEHNYLLPVVEIEDRLIKTSDQKFKLILKVNDCLNIDLLGPEDIERAVESIQQSLNSVSNKNIQILISSEKIDIRDYFLYLDQIKEQIDQDIEDLNYIPSSLPTLHHKQQMAMEKKNFLIQYQETTKNIHNFYIVLTSEQEDRAEAYSELYDLFISFNQYLGQSEMSCDLVTSEEILQVLYQKLNPQTSIVQPFQPDMTLQDVYPFAIAKKGPSVLQVDDRLYSFFTFISLPQQVKHSWLKSILECSNINLDLSISLKSADKSEVLRSTSSKIVDLESKLADNLTPQFRQKYSNEKDRMEKLLSRITSDEESMFNTTFVLTLSAENEQDLKSAEKRLTSSIGSARIRSKKILFQDHELLWYSLPIGFQKETLESRISWPMNAELIGSILPFNSSELNFNEGSLKGINRRTETPIIYNRFDRNHFNNPNEIVTGESGSGKSYYLRLDQERQSNFGGVERIFTIDPEREYTFPHSQKVIFRLGSTFTTNPFHIRSAVLDSDSEIVDSADVSGFLRRKISEMMSFFRWIIPDMSQLQANILTEAIRKSYEDYKLNLNSGIQTLPDQFPTLTDLTKNLRGLSADLTDIEHITRSLAPFVDGVYSDMFNGQTNWDMNNRITVLDIHELTDEVKRPLMDLLIKSIWEEIKINRNEKIGFYCDEAHFLVDEQNQQTMYFFWQLAKRIRKYSGYLVTATQNIDDFLSVGKYGSAIFNNAYIKSFFRMSERDVEQLSKFMRFSQKELKILGKRKGQGSCLHMVGEKRVEMRTIATPHEVETLKL